MDKHPGVAAIESRRNWRTADCSGIERDLIRRDETVSFKQANATPALMALASAQGSWIEDLSGKRYLDFYGNNCHHVGHRHPAVVAGVKAQLDRLTMVSRGLTSASSVALAERLASVYPERGSKILLVPGGAAAVELALMICKVNTGRYKTISFWDAYHGRSAGALSVGGSPRDKSPRMGPLLPGALHAPPFYWFARKGKVGDTDIALSARRSLDFLKALLDAERDVAALIAEPVRNGPYVPPDGYWAEVRTLCDQYGTLLIFDDIPTGLGKTGSLFNAQRVGVLPDITVVGKALGGGIAPLAAVIARADLDSTGEFNLGYFTHEKNAFAAAAGLATLDVIVQEKLADRSQSLGLLAAEELARMLGTEPSLVNYRQAGLMFSLEFTGEPADSVAPSFCRSAYFETIRRGVLPMPPKGCVLSFSAPLNIEKPDLNLALAAIGESVRAVARG